MEYISLTNLQNKYPTTLNYETGTDKKVRLFGAYRLLNKLVFSEPKIKLDVVEKIDGTSFNFVIGIKNKDTDSFPSKYFTSPQYYNKLKLSSNQSNPYFINRALDDKNIVIFSLEETTKILKSLQESEKTDLVTLPIHIYLDSDGKVDYEKLIKYIDWLVAPVSASDAINGGVLLEKSLGGSDIKIEKKVLESLPSSATTGGGGSSNNNFGGSSSGGSSSGAGTFVGGSTGGGYGGRPGDASSGNANYTGNQYDQFGG
jgi:uncharacterized membrane protein YgcG